MRQVGSSDACASAFGFLVHAARKLTAGESAEQAPQTLVDLIRDHWRPDAVSLARVGPQGHLVFCAASGAMADQVVGMSIPPGHGIVGWVAKHRKGVWLPDVVADGRFFNGVDRATGFRTRAILAVPLMVGGEVLAVLEFLNPQPDTDMALVEDVLAALALLIAPAIANVALTERADQAERRYQRLFELNLDPIVVLSQDGEIVEANQTAQATLDVSVIDAEGRDRYDRRHLPRLGFAEQLLPDMTDAAQQEGTVTWEYQLPDEERYVEARLSYLPDYLPGGGTYLWIGHDITDRVDLESARQKFIHMIVHDLRAPLSSVQNSLELVLTAWREQDVTMPIEQVLGIGLRSANRMDRLISDILDSAALQARERTLDISEVSVPTLISDALETVSSSADRRDQEISIVIDPDLPMLLGDVDLLRRVLINLLTNAVKYTQECGVIVVEARAVATSVEPDGPSGGASRREVHFSVSDNGPGIGPDIRDNLFKLYVRGSDRRAKGTGIGLAFCKLAVEAHGGRIWFEDIRLSDETGDGTRFTFAVPLVPPNASGDGEGYLQ